MNVALLLELLTRALTLGAQYNALIADIRDNHPDVWEKVQAKYTQASADFEASVARNRAAGEG